MAAEDYVLRPFEGNTNTGDPTVIKKFPQSNKRDGQGS